MDTWPLEIIHPALDHYLFPDRVKCILQAPYISDEELKSVGIQTSKVLELCCSLIDRYFLGSYENMCNYLGFKPEHKELFIRLNTKINHEVLARSDLVRVGNKWKLHELNVGSNLLTSLAVASLPSISGLYQKFDALDSWGKIMSESWNCGPTFAFIIEQQYIEEARVTLNLFIPPLKKYSNMDIVILSEDDVLFENNSLTDKKGNKIDFVYPIFNELSIDPNPIKFESILRAISTQSVLCPMSPSYSLISNKGMLALLWELSDKKFLTDSEINLVHEFIPKTYWVNKMNLSFALENQNQLVLKPLNYLQGINVWAGSEVSKENWLNLLNGIISDTKSERYVIQDYTPAEINVIKVTDGRNIHEVENRLSWGVYVFGNKLLGGMLRGRPIDSSVIFKAVDITRCIGPLTENNLEIRTT